MEVELVSKFEELVKKVSDRTGSIASIAIQVLHVSGSTEIVYDLISIGPENSGESQLLHSFDNFDELVTYINSKYGD